MIDFRYHLVSLIAVFLAIALGLVIGATQLSGPVLDNLRGQVTSLQEDKRELEDTTQGLQTRVDGDQAFQSAVAPTLVEGSLTGRSVLFVLASEDVTTDTVEEVTALVTAAGGTVNGQLTLLPAYSDPATESALQSFVTTPAGRPAGVELPETDDTGQLVGALLAEVLMVPTTPGAAVPDGAAVSTVLAGLQALDALSRDSDSVTPADFAVVLTTGALEGEDAADRTDTVLDLVRALDAAGSGAVVAGDADSDADGGLVGAVRADPETSAAVSSVDNVTGPAGQASTVLALAAEREGTSGAYGTGEDAQPVPPLPATTP